MRQRTAAVVAAGLVAAVAATVVVLVGTSGTEPPDAQRRPGPSASAPSLPSPGDSASAAEDSATGPVETGFVPGPFTPAAYDGWLAEVPADFPLARGLPDDGGDFTRSEEPVTGEFCGTGAFPGDAVVDALRDGATGPELLDARDLRLFEDDRAAHRFLARATRAVVRCPEDPHDGGVWRHDVRVTDLGEEGVLAVRTYETDGRVLVGATFWHLVRVGNAVLLTGASGEYLAGETLGTGIRDHQQLLRPVIDAMCLFSADGC